MDNLERHEWPANLATQVSDLTNSIKHYKFKAALKLLVQLDDEIERKQQEP